MQKDVKTTIIQVSFLILLAIAIVVLTLTLIALVKEREVAFGDPCKYVKEHLGMQACACLDKDGNEWISGSDDTWRPSGYNTNKFEVVDPSEWTG